MSLGNTLRAAREAHGITTSELAARTHMLVQIVEGLENEDFRRIPAPIYGRGFIKLYCEAVKLDPKPLQAEFMELFNKPKDAPPPVAPPPAVRLTPPTPPPDPQPAIPAETSPAEAPIEDRPSIDDATAVSESTTEEQSSEPVPPVQEPPSMADFGELFAQPATPAPQPPPIMRPPARSRPDSAAIPPKKSYGDIFGQSYAAEEEVPKTSAAEKFRNTMSNVSSGVFANVQKLPPNTGRIVTVSICALLAIAIMGWGVLELYKATTPVAGAAASAESAGSPDGESPSEESAKTEINGKTERKDKPEAASASEEKKRNIPKAPSVKPGDLKSSGIEIPALYID